MFDLIIGGSGSGKSEFAENCCMEKSGEKLYIATMEPFGEEGARRIARHRRLRAGKGFVTLECYTHLEEAEIPAGSVVLLECMSNLLANEIFSPDGRKQGLPDLIEKGMEHLLEQAGHVVVVTNDVFADGMTYDRETEDYRRQLAEVNRRLAAKADRVYEVVCGIPLKIREKTG